MTYNIVASYCSLRLTVFIQWIEHPICILKMPTKDSTLNLMPKLKAVTSTSNVVKLLKTKLLAYELHHVPNDWKTWNDKTIVSIKINCNIDDTCSKKNSGVISA